MVICLLILQKLVFLIQLSALLALLFWISARSKRVTDKDRIKELTEHIDGKANTQKTRTHFHEEQSDDEVPEEYAERDAPAYDSSTSRYELPDTHIMNLSL